MGFGDPNNGQHSWTIGELETRDIIKAALEGGINFFDTSIGYQIGTSERYVGRALRDFAKREDVVVATKKHHLDGMIKAVDLDLTPEEIEYLEECYVPHQLVGVMAQNTPAMSKSKQVWTRTSDILK